MTLRTARWTLTLLTLLCAPALAWNAEGHDVVGSIADQFLNDHAKQEVAGLVGTDLRTASAWADCAKSVERRSDGTFHYVVNRQFERPCTSLDHDAMVDYVSRNWDNCLYEDMPTNCHKAFHFTDVAIQHDDYERTFIGTSDHDVVSAINAAVMVLQGQAAPDPFRIKDKAEALFLLSHFLGDLHQPLHVGAVYLDAEGNKVNPDQGTFDKHSETAGGNLISEESSSGENLHAHWDAIPRRLGERADAFMLAEARVVPRSAGPMEGWPAAWASETVLAAHQALSFTGTGEQRWSVQFDDMRSYVRNENALKEQQIAKAGARLAELLNAIWP